MNVSHLRPANEGASAFSHRGPNSVEKGGGGGHDGGMEARVAKLEAVVPTLATKSDVEAVRADLHKVSSEMKGWFVATAVLVLVGLSTIANIMISNVRSLADKGSATPTAAAPYIIQVPAAPAQPPPAPVNKQP